MNESDNACLELETAMTDLRSDLIHGRLDGLTARAEQIEGLLPKLAALRDGPQALRLRGMAVENATCLEAAQRGVRAARNRLAEVTAAAQGFSTYDGQGRRAQIEAAGRKLTQRF